MSKPASIEASPRPLAAYLSLMLLVSVAAIKTLLAKVVFERLPTPIAYSLLSAAITSSIAWLPALISNGGLPCVRADDAHMLLLVAVATAVDLGMSNVAISMLPLALQQAIASAIPAATILLETVVFWRLKPLANYIAIAALCCGALLGHLGSLPHLERETTLLGEGAMLVAIFAAAAKYVFAKATIQEWKQRLGSFGVLLWMELLIVSLLLPWAIWNGELTLTLIRPSPSPSPSSTSSLPRQASACCC